MPASVDSTQYRNPIPTTDLVIEYSNGVKEGIVLIERGNPPYGLALPGGFHELGLSAEENAIKEAREETGLDVTILNPGKPFGYYSNPNRDPRHHMVSAAYVARGTGKLQAGDDAKEAFLYSIDEVIGMLGRNQFAFDHEDIIVDYLKHRGHLE